MRRRTILFASVLAAATVFSSRESFSEPHPAPSLAELRRDFANPPASARLRCYWWWLNGNTDKETITRDLEEMKAKGFGGAILVDANGAAQEGNSPVPAGPMFTSPAWVELYKHALREADRLGLEITLNINSGWNLGGPRVKPEDASKVLTFSRTDIQGGSPVSVRVEAPPSVNGFYRDIAVLAYPLHHGRAMAEQMNDRLGDRHTVTERGAASSLEFRSAAREAGFSMPDTSRMLESGVATVFRNDPTYADAKLNEVRVLTSLMDTSGRISVDLPAGDWELLRIGYTDSDARVSTSSGEWQGLAIDHLSRRAFMTYWNDVVEPLLAAAKPYTSLRYLATDSWELGGTNWTDDFREQFAKRRGYDPIKYLAVVAGRIVEDRETSTRFLTDLRRTVADLISAEHYDVFAAMAQKHGLGIQAESGGPHGAPIDALETFRHAAVPQTEFWAQNSHRSSDVERFFTKEAASAANIYGQRFVAQEGETSIGPHWSESLARDLKPAFDMAITEGMNRLVWHAFTSSPRSAGVPGQEYFAGTHFNPQVTWWNHSDAFVGYLNRVQYMMQQGVPVNDVLYFYGDHTPNFVRLKADDPARVLPGYDYDVTNEDALLHAVQVRGGKIAGPGGVQWSALVLPRTKRISLPVLQFVEKYLQSGGTVVSPKPVGPTGNISSSDTARFIELADALWGDCASEREVGRGRLFCNDDVRGALQAEHIEPDVELQDGALRASSTTGIDYAHRRVGEKDVYFVRNAEGHPINTSVLLRAHGEPELWDAVSGEVRKVAFNTRGGRTQINLELPAFGSVFLVFVPHSSASAKEEVERMETLHARWTVSFPASPITAATSFEMKELRSWTMQKDVRFFSGTATYTTQISSPKLAAGEKACLRFGDVREIAEVFLNGKKLQTVWAAPYETCVMASLLKEGGNQLEVRVTNLWRNALVGKAKGMDPEDRLMTNIHLPQSSEGPLDSGLIGDVVWVIKK